MSRTLSRPFDSAMVRLVPRLVFSVVIGGTFTACSGDQSDQPPPRDPSTQASADEAEASLEVGGADIPGCPCGLLKNPIRGTVVAFEAREGSSRGGSVRLRVEELLGSTADVEVGSEIEAGWSGSLPCVGPATIAAGDAVLAFYRPARPCPPDATCADGDTVGAGVALTPWGETAMLADTSADPDLAMSISDLSLLDAPYEECRSGLGNISEFLGPDDDVP
jgi:hypothetical protein